MGNARTYRTLTANGRMTMARVFLCRRNGRSGRDAAEKKEGELTIRGPNGEILDITEKEMQAIKVCDGVIMQQQQVGRH